MQAKKVLAVDFLDFVTDANHMIVPILKGPKQRPPGWLQPKRPWADGSKAAHYRVRRKPAA
jgi:hypothetical protein